METNPMAKQSGRNGSCVATGYQVCSGSSGHLLAGRHSRPLQTGRGADPVPRRSSRGGARARPHPLRQQRQPLVFAPGDDDSAFFRRARRRWQAASPGRTQASYLKTHAPYKRVSNAELRGAGRHRSRCHRHILVRTVIPAWDDPDDPLGRSRPHAGRGRRRRLRPSGHQGPATQAGVPRGRHYSQQPPTTPSCSRAVFPPC